MHRAICSCGGLGVGKNCQTKYRISNNIAFMLIPVIHYIETSYSGDKPYDGSPLAIKNQTGTLIDLSAGDQDDDLIDHWLQLLPTLLSYHVPAALQQPCWMSFHSFSFVKIYLLLQSNVWTNIPDTEFTSIQLNIWAFATVLARPDHTKSSQACSTTPKIRVPVCWFGWKHFQHILEHVLANLHQLPLKSTLYFE